MSNGTTWPDRTRTDLETRIEALRAELSSLEAELERLDDVEQEASTPAQLPLRMDEYKRYGRQMILPGFGLPGQLALKQARLLVVGAGGLGCPAMLYLAGAGIGHISVIDNDTVETSNLHRQVLHTQSRVGMAKAESAAIGMRSINPRVQVTPIVERFTAASIQGANPHIDLSTFDLVLDCTDNATTRYLLSDACVQAGVILVSGGAVGLEGWSGVWNLPALQGRTSREAKGESAAADEESLPSTGQPEYARGPCLRCIYPQGAQDNSGNCEDDGILGTVVGVVGTLMANDAIKLLVGVHELKPCMTLFSPFISPMFRNLKLRGRKPSCPGCSPQASRARGTCGIDDMLNDADVHCGAAETPEDSRVSAKELLEMQETGRPPVLIDVRPAVEFGICALPGSLNLPHTDIKRDPSLLTALLEEKNKSDNDVILICRRGNDSLVDARVLRSQTVTGYARIRDLRGGLQAWSRADPIFPLY